MFRYSLLFRLWLLVIAFNPLSPAFGQNSSGDNSTVVYPASYFAEFAPVTAQDMLNRIPGMDSGSRGGGPPGGGRFGGGRGPGGGSGGRGFGSGSGGSEILINGKRTAGKNNQASGQLDRITAAQVNYIELIRGTSGSLDVRGSGQVINVVLFEELSTSSISYEAGVDQSRDRTLSPVARSPTVVSMEGSAICSV